MTKVTPTIGNQISHLKDLRDELEQIFDEIDCWKDFEDVTMSIHKAMGNIDLAVEGLEANYEPTEDEINFRGVDLYDDKNNYR